MRVSKDRIDMDDKTLQKPVLKDYSEAVARDPKLAHAYVERGGVHAELGEFEEALTDFGRAIDVDETHAHAYLHRGLTLAMLGDLNVALADLNRAIELAPDEPLAWLSRGRARAEEGDIEAAVGDLDQAVKLAPENPWAYTHRGLLRAAAGDVEAVQRRSSDHLRKRNLVVLNGHHLICGATYQEMLAGRSTQSPPPLKPGDEGPGQYL